MKAPERDQPETRAAIGEFNIFERYPTSTLTPRFGQVAEAGRPMSAAFYQVGVYYHRVKWYPGAIDRFKEISVTIRYSGRDGSTSPRGLPHEDR
jgi:outer membrane protein assembly factor BamD (BamD/ComL family)